MFSPKQETIRESGAERVDASGKATIKQTITTDRETMQWNADCEQIVVTARRLLRKAMCNTKGITNFNLEMRNKYSLVTIINEEQRKAITRLVSRIYNPSIRKAEFDTCYATAINYWQRCLVQYNQLDTRWSDRNAEKEAAAKNAFCCWWVEHFVLFMYDSFRDMTWLRSFLKENTKRQVKDKLRNNTLCTELAERALREISKQILNEINVEIVQKINFCCKSPLRPMAVSEFAFEVVPYVDNGNMLKQLSEYVDHCILYYNQHDRNEVLPGFAVCQSSGCGKSRLVTELAKTRPVMYMSLQNVDSDEYPPGTTNLVNQCFTKDGNQAIHARALHKAVNKCWNFYHETGASPTHMESAQVYDNLFEEDLGSVHKVPVVRQPFQLGNVVLLVVDVALELLEVDKFEVSMFHKLFSFLQSSWNTHPVFAILVDSDIRIAQMHLPMSENSSISQYTTDKCVLFNPFILTEWNESALKIIHEDKAFQHELLNNIKSNRGSDWQAIKHNESSRDFFGENALATNWIFVASLHQMGRPLWYFRFHDIKSMNLFYPATFESNLAMLLCRTGGTMPLESKLGQLLVAQFMAVIGHDATGKSFIGYKSDPFLAYAASHGWKRENALIRRVIPAAIQAKSENIIEQHSISAIEARIIILRILDSASHDGNEYWCLVTTFLGAFKSDFDMQHVPVDARISVFHFVQYVHEVTVCDLAHLVQRRAAAILPNGTILLPFWYMPESIKYGYILLQQLDDPSCLSLAIRNVQALHLFSNLNPLRMDEQFTNTSTAIIINLLNATPDALIPESVLINCGISSFYWYLESAVDFIQELLQAKPMRTWSRPKLKLPVSSSSSASTLPSFK